MKNMLATFTNVGIVVLHVFTGRIINFEAMIDKKLLRVASFML